MTRQISDINLPTLSHDGHPSEESPVCFKYDCLSSGLDFLLLGERQKRFQFLQV